ncbi:hypothetical protein BKA70DRAFT_1233334 [Coprinopsis sp. MPI-PUGE-AT-0042]|nr:hypothetical protein BKA70DRAFT_1233334 [Coprinopsis sp. MPI-PUGE-AT-0042]
MNKMFPFISRNTTSVPSRPGEGFRDTPDPIDDDSDTSTNAQAHAPVSSAIPLSASASQSSLVSRPSSTTRRRSTRPSEDPGVKCRIVARNDPREQEAMAKVFERLTAMNLNKKLTFPDGKTGPKTNNTTQIAGGVSREARESTLELKECQEKLEHALQAQRTNEGLIEALRKEIAEKSCEIDVLKEDIRVRDGTISELSVSCANRIVEVEEEAHAKVNESRTREAAAREQLEELRKAAEKADMVEENRPQDRMDTDDGMRDGREGQSQDDGRMDTNSLQAEGGTVRQEDAEARSPPQTPVRQRGSGGRPGYKLPATGTSLPLQPDSLIPSRVRARDMCWQPLPRRRLLPHQLVPLIKAVVAELTGGSSKQRPPPMAHAFQKRVVRNPDPKRNELLSVVRAHMNMLMGISQDLDLLASAAATEDEDAIADFEAGEGEEPPLVPLKPCWSTLKSEWNAVLARKFVEYMWKETMDEMFLDRLKRQRALAEGEWPQEGEDEEAWVWRLFKKRRLISSEARDDPEEAKAWEEIDRVVEELGAGGMSSDESEYDEYEEKASTYQHPIFCPGGQRVLKSL